jgi:hypothetical protein
MAQNEQAMKEVLDNMARREARAVRQARARREDRSAMVRATARSRRGI